MYRITMCRVTSSLSRLIHAQLKPHHAFSRAYTLPTLPTLTQRTIARWGRVGAGVHFNPDGLI